MRQSFQVGDKAVYPVHGVAEVVSLESRDIGGSSTSVYILQILETGLKIMVPVTNAGTVGLREIITSKQVKEVYAILKSRDVPRDTQTWNRRYREYMEKIKTGSVFEIAEVLRDLSVLRSTKDLSFGERRMLDTARNLIVKELAVARRWSEEKAEKELEKYRDGEAPQQRVGAKRPRKIHGIAAERHEVDDPFERTRPRRPGPAEPPSAARIPRVPAPPQRRFFPTAVPC